MSHTESAHEGYHTVESLEEARKLVDGLKNEETMLKSVVQGDGLLSGHCDEIRRYDHNEDRVQIQPPLVGHVIWSDIDDVARDIYEKQLRVKVVEWKSRFASLEESHE